MLSWFPREPAFLFVAVVLRSSGRGRFLFARGFEVGLTVTRNDDLRRYVKRFESGL